MMPDRYITEKFEGPSQIVDMVALAKENTYPIFVLKMQKQKKPSVPSVKVELNDALYEYLVGIYGTDEIVFYCNLQSAMIGAFSPDMQISYDFLQSQGLVSKCETWVKKAVPYITEIMKRRLTR